MKLKSPQGLSDLVMRHGLVYRYAETRFRHNVRNLKPPGISIADLSNGRDGLGVPSSSFNPCWPLIAGKEPGRSIIPDAYTKIAQVA